ncbi:glycosyltransferase family 4 protein [Nocardioides sp. HB32]
MLSAIAARLADDGHDVVVLTCQPSYGSRARAAARERVDDYRVVRWRVLDDRRSAGRKLLNSAWFCARLLVGRRHWRGADVIMAATTPPVVVALVCSLIARACGARFVYHKQDIWPEVSTARGVLSSTLRKMDGATDRRAWRVVTLSEDMARTTRSRPGGDSVEVMVLNNFDPWALDEPTIERRRRDGLRIVYAGNLGRFQGLEHLVEVVRAARDLDGIEWHFFGDGSMRSEIEALAASSASVHCHGHRPPDEIAEFVQDSDLGCVSLNEGVIQAAYPSKILTYLRHGLPVLALVEPDSEMARMIATEDIGIVVRQPDHALAAEQLGKLAVDRDRLVAMRARSKSVYEQRFAMSRALDTWSVLVEGR